MDMKPTQEQVIAWAREAGIKINPESAYAMEMHRFAILAYEAGRKDENEAAIEIVARHGGSVEIEVAIRARREQ